MYSLEEFSKVVSAAVGPLPGEGVFSEHVRHHVVLALWLEEGLALDVVVVLHVQPAEHNHQSQHTRQQFSNTRCVFCKLIPRGFLFVLTRGRAREQL